MTDRMTKAQRSFTMSRIRSSGNASTELRFLALLRRAKIAGWRRRVRLPGHPDFVFPCERVAVFLDGCFWHGCPKCYSPPKSNLDYWIEKIATNVARDKRVHSDLEASGWRVIRIWEHSLLSRPSNAVRRLQAILRQGPSVRDSRARAD